MKNLTRFFLGFGLLVVIIFCGCNADPQADIRGAQRAMEKAKDLHAEELATPEWKEALQAWEEGQAVLAKGKSSKAYFYKAKGLFEKARLAAEIKGAAIAKEIGEIQKAINESYMKAKAALEKGRVKPKILKELKPMLIEVAVDSSSVKDLLMECDYSQAKTKVLETQQKMLNAELILAGQKPAN
jgi:hypothetical protein